jgi:hypothetical protein
MLLALPLTEKRSKPIKILGGRRLAFEVAVASLGVV